MAAHAETAEKAQEATKSGAEATKAEDKGGNGKIGRVFTDARDQLEKLWTDTFGELNTRFHSAEGEVKDLVKRLEVDGRDRLTKVLEVLKLDKWTSGGAKELLTNPTKLRDELVEQGQVLAQESADRLGLATEAQLATLTTEIAALSAKFDKLAKAASGATKKSVTDLAKRVKALESGLKAAPKKAAPKKAAPRKAAPTKVAPKS